MTQQDGQGASGSAQGSLRRSEERFRLLVESVEDYAIFMLDTEGRVMSWNIGAQKTKGYRAAEIIGHSFERFYTPEAVASGWPREELRRAASVGRLEDEGWRVRKDGSLFWANVIITALRDETGTLQGFAKVTRDLTQRRAQEQVLRQSEEQFRRLVESVKDYAIFMLDPQGYVRTWNVGAQLMKGYSAEEAIGLSFSMFFTAQERAAGKPEEEIETALRDGRAEAEGWRVRKDGSVFWANVVITPMTDVHGALMGFAKVTRDLSDQQRLSELESSSQRMSEFLAMLAHELRNPLAPIRNAVSILTEVQTALPPPVVRTGQIIDRQLGHLTRLVDDLLDVGRIVTGKILLKPESLNYRDVVLAGVEAVRPAIAARGQQLEVEVPDAPIGMTGDATRLLQALQNLLNNATRYTPEGGSIRVTVALEGSNVVTAVADNGKGIASDSLERIFELFVQGDSASAGDQSGLGIGLSLAKSLVEQHGGTLTAASKGVGQGSTFTIRLPMRQRPVNASANAARPRTVELESLRVLVVDDNQDSTDTMVNLLELLGHEVRGAYGAAHALSVAGAFEPRIVLLDLNMPDGDGFSVMKQLRQQSSRPLYIAAMTGYGQKEDLQSTLQAGFQTHLTKPVGIEDLRRALHEARQKFGR